MTQSNTAGRPSPREGAASAIPRDSDRTVHARLGERELVRYDRQGRWYVEGPEGRKQRLETVHEAARTAVNFERDGGEIFTGRTGGKQFDAKVAGCRRREKR